MPLSSLFREMGFPHLPQNFNEDVAKVMRG